MLFKKLVIWIPVYALVVGSFWNGPLVVMAFFATVPTILVRMRWGNRLSRRHYYPFQHASDWELEVEKGVPNLFSAFGPRYFRDDVLRTYRCTACGRSEFVRG